VAGDPETVDPTTALPDWVPEPARRYIAHTEAGTSIRALARRAGCHASTVLRQIRACEARRDDPLVDAALRRIGRRAAPLTCPERQTAGNTAAMQSQPGQG
jgi:lambda repressor-like predicted transcriptional regulator